jgi:predicted acyl esterase
MTKEDLRDGMRVLWDVPVRMDDGNEIRLDVFLPIGQERVPALLSYGAYGKGLSMQEGYPTAWDQMIKEYPEVNRGSSGLYQNWEVADPEKWVPLGYACIRVDARGAGRSPGTMESHSKREIHDIYECIEWAAQQPWSNGKIGMAGISYYASNQWHVAALRPPHLAAICPWEGYNDRYREAAYHGGIRSTFLKNLQGMQILTVQHGRGVNGPRSRVTGELVAGPETLSDEELARNRVLAWPPVLEHPLFDAYHQERRPRLEDIEVPVLSCANWGGQGLHTRGNFEGYLRAGSRHKSLEVHGGSHWAMFYTDYAIAMQKQFFDRYLKGENNGWDERPAVTLQIRHVDRFVQRFEHEWPLARTQWTRFYMDPATLKLTRQPPSREASVSYAGLGEGLTFRTDPLSEPMEITGPSALKLRLSSSTSDADIFAVVRVFDPSGSEVVFQGALDPHTPIAQGWLRASHRKLDDNLSLPWRPYHTHDQVQPLAPGEQVQLDVEIWPTCIVIPAGYTLALTIRGKDYEWDGPPATLSNLRNPLRGCGPFLHDDPDDRPAEVFDGEVTLHLGDEACSHLLLPVIAS